MLKSNPKRVFLFCSVTLVALAACLLDLTSPAIAQSASQPTIIILKEIKLIGRKTPPKPPATQGKNPSAAASNVVILKEIKLIGRKTPPKPKPAQGNIPPASTSNIITLKEIKLIGRKGSSTAAQAIIVRQVPETPPLILYGHGVPVGTPPPPDDKTVQAQDLVIAVLPIGGSSLPGKTITRSVPQSPPVVVYGHGVPVGTPPPPDDKTVQAQDLVIAVLPIEGGISPTTKIAKASDIVIIGKAPLVGGKGFAQTANVPPDDKTVQAQDLVIAVLPIGGSSLPEKTITRSVPQSPPVVVYGHGVPVGTPPPPDDKTAQAQDLVIAVLPIEGGISPTTKIAKASDIVIIGKAPLVGGKGFAQTANVPPPGGSVSVRAPNLVLTSKSAARRPEQKTVTAPNLVLTSKSAARRPEQKTVTAPNLVLTSKSAARRPEQKTVKAPNLVLTAKGSQERSLVPEATFARDGRVTVVDVGEIKLIGEPKENKFTINGGELKAIGDRPGRVRVLRPGALPGRVKVSLLRVRKLSGETNPFDPVEVEEDVTAAQNGTLNQTPATALPNFNVLPTGPMATPIIFDIEPLLNNELIIQPVFVNLGVSAVGINIIGVNSFEADVIAGFTLISRTVANPIAGGTNVTMVVRRNSDDKVFQLNFRVAEIIGGPEVQSLTGFDCGTSAGNCP